MLGFLERLTLEPDRVGAGDIAPLRAAGLSDAAIEDAIHVTVLFNIYDRVADTLEFDIPGPESFAQGADMLLKRGYQ
jgi:alkylhydroperoxidase family enzyme